MIEEWDLDDGVLGEGWGRGSDDDADFDGRVRHRLFVDGGERPPRVATRIVPLADWFGDGRGCYQVVVEIDGVRAPDSASWTVPIDAR